MIDEVTPRYDWDATRTYVLKGTYICCYAYSERSNPDRIPLFQINLKTEQQAQDVMEDLYYGEYDGG